MLYEKKIIDSLKLLQQPTQIINILADRSGVEPRAPYCLITLLPVRNVGLPYRTSTRKDGQEFETVIQTKELQTSLTFHLEGNSELQDYVEMFHLGLGSSFYQAAFTANGLGIFDYTDIVYQSLSIDGKNFKRAIIDIYFRFERNDNFHAPFIKRINIQNKAIEFNLDTDTGIGFVWDNGVAVRTDESKEYVQFEYDEVFKE